LGNPSKKPKGTERKDSKGENHLNPKILKYQCPKIRGQNFYIKMKELPNCNPQYNNFEENKLTVKQKRGSINF